MRKSITLLLLFIGFYSLSLCQEIVLTSTQSNPSWNIIVNALSEEQENIWIDWNNNGTLDAGEKVNLFDTAISRSTTQATIVIHGNINVLKCSSNSIKELDLEKAPLLRELFCFDNQLSELSLDKQTELTDLYCFDNPIPQLIVSQCTKLQTLHCYNTHIKELQLQSLSKLENLNCRSCMLSNLDVTNNSQLTQLFCQNNRLEKLDLSACPLLERVRCSDNKLTSLTIGECPSLRDLNLFGNALSSAQTEEIAQRLPSIAEGEKKGVLTAIDSKLLPQDQNVWTKKSVQLLVNKNWEVYDWRGFDNYGENPYEGIDETFTIPTEAAQLHIFCAGPAYIIQGLPSNQEVRIYTMEGALLLTTKTDNKGEAQVTLLPRNLILQAGNLTVKLIR